MALLTKVEATLPSDWYYDETQYAKELAAIWYRDWICVGRQEEIANTGDYKTATVGKQRLILTRNREGQVRAFHNTCRHRGSTLCTNESGHFANGRIICPYHTWTYSLDGGLIATPTRVETEDFSADDFPLYRVHVDSWGGFLFVNLSKEPSMSLIDQLGDATREIENWPLADMVSVFQERSSLACNWKIFWENYCECYHCPRLHPELCKIVPVYKKGILGNDDDSGWTPKYADDDGRPRIGGEHTTWTMDGKSTLPPIEGLTDEQREIGMNFVSFTASLYVVGHTDYVRSVRLEPTGPESVDLVIDWLLLPEVTSTHASEIDRMVEFGQLVVEQDGRICEINQQGLRSPRHDHGVLVPQEEELWRFHEWLRDRLAQ